jgi:transposase
MGSGKRVPEAIRWIIIRLGATMTEEEVSMYTDIGVRTVRKILAHFKRTGAVEEPKQKIPQLHRGLCDYDIQVSTYHSFLTI